MTASSVAQAKARKEKLLRDERCRAAHCLVARALRDPALAPKVLEAATVQIKKWREQKLCSLDYIEAWEKLLEQPEEVARVLEDNSGYATQLRQNGPFVSTIRQLRLHAAGTRGVY